MGKTENIIQPRGRALGNNLNRPIIKVAVLTVDTIGIRTFRDDMPVSYPLYPAIRSGGDPFNGKRGPFTHNVWGLDSRRQKNPVAWRNLHLLHQQFFRKRPINKCRYCEEEIRHLERRDKRLGADIEEIGMIARRVNPDLFGALVASAASQQISTKAAETVRARMEARFNRITTGAVAPASCEDIRQFECPKHLVNWAGLAPAVYESAGKTAHGHITKRGSKYLRTMLIEAPHSIARGKPNRVKDFFARIRSRKGYKNAIVALARYLLSIIHNLLVDHETSVESPGTMKKIPGPVASPVPVTDYDSMIRILTRAGYMVNRRHPSG